MTTAREFVDKLAASGKYHFTIEDAVHAVGSSTASVQAALRRLKSEGVVAAPYRGFHVIVPYQYRAFGCLPPEQFVPQLMEYLGLSYYVALLTAAAFHGSAHQKPQTFQVMLQSPRRPLLCGTSRVQFVARKELERTPVESISTPRGPCRLSSREATALELVGYPEQCAGLNNVATILAELGPELEGDKLLCALPLYPIAWVQRLGFLLELVGEGPDLAPLAEFVMKHAQATAPLVRAHERSRAPRSSRWKVLINAEVEPD